MVRLVNLEKVQTFVDRFGETDGLRDLVDGSDSAAGDPANFVGNFVADVGSAEYGSLGDHAPGAFETGPDFSLFLGEFRAYLLHSKSPFLFGPDYLGGWFGPSD